MIGTAEAVAAREVAVEAEVAAGAGAGLAFNFSQSRCRSEAVLDSGILVKSATLQGCQSERTAGWFFGHTSPSRYTLVSVALSLTDSTVVRWRLPRRTRR
jgi:hypothetical protein